MKKLHLGFGLFLLVIVGFSCDFRSKRESGSKLPAKLSSPDPINPAGFQPVVARLALSTPIVSPEQIEAAFRLAPDRRCLWAVAELHCLLTGDEKTAAEAEFRSGQWKILYRGQAVGELPEFPDFSDLLRLLTNWTVRLRAESKATPRVGGQPSREIAAALANLQPLAALQAADRLWSREQLDASLARQTAQALALLAFLDLDVVEAVDAIPARALAALTVSENLATSPAVRERCVLAKAMHYDADAFQLAAQLPDTDPLRLYLGREDEKLAAAARRETSPPEVRYLYARRLDERHDMRGWLDWIGAQPQGTPSLRLSLLRTGLEFAEFETQVPLSLLLIAATLEDLKPFSPAAGAMTPTRDEDGLQNPLARIESALAGLEVKPGRPLLDRELLEAHFRSSYYSALFSMGLHYLDSLSSIEATNEFSRSLDETPAAPAGEFRKWYLHLAKAKAGRASQAELRNDLSALTSFGEPLLDRTYEEIDNSAAYGDLTLSGAGRVLAARLDTRPKHRLQMGLKTRDFCALSLAEKLLASAVPAQGFLNLSVQAWYASIGGDRRRVEKLLRQPELAPQERIRVLTYLKYQDGITPADMRSEYERLIAAQPENWKLSAAYVEYLQEFRDWEKAREVTQAWIDRKVTDTGGFDHIFAHTTLARLYYRQRRYSEGLEAVEPVVESWQFGALNWKALLLDRLGRKEEAMTLGQAAMERYPDNLPALVLLVELDWRNGRYQQAAARLAQWRYPLSSTSWRFTVGPVFVECFEGRDPEAVQAAQALMAVNLARGHDLGQLAAEAAFKGNPALAFEIQSRLRGAGLEQLDMFTSAYGYLKKSKGQAAALDWLRARVPEQARMMLSMFAHPNHHELLWEIAPAALTGFGADYYWLMRAASAIKPGSGQGSHVAEIRQHYGGGASSHYDLAGRYLLGLAEEKDVLSAATSPKAQCELFYFIGYKAQCKGKIRTAADWFWLSHATGLLNNGEARWAYNQLHKWKDESRSLARLEAGANLR